MYSVSAVMFETPQNQMAGEYQHHLILSIKHRSETLVRKKAKSNNLVDIKANHLSLSLTAKLNSQDAIKHYQGSRFSSHTHNNLGGCFKIGLAC